MYVLYNTIKMNDVRNNNIEKEKVGMYLGFTF
jgi:hypothetical protein